MRICRHLDLDSCYDCAACRAQTDKIFSQQSALGKSQEELRSLRAQLEKRAAQQELIEAEIARQVEEYGRLKKQLVNQEELQVMLIDNLVLIYNVCTLMLAVKLLCGILNKHCLCFLSGNNTGMIHCSAGCSGNKDRAIVLRIYTL